MKADANSGMGGTGAPSLLQHLSRHSASANSKMDHMPAFQRQASDNGSACEPCARAGTPTLPPADTRLQSW